MQEKRSAPREVATLLGTLAFDRSGAPQGATAACVVLDLSEIGARLLVDEDVALPSVFDLHVHRPDTTYRARSQWRAGDEMGVAFEQP